VLVTGASGFIGRVLCRALRARGHDVIALSSRDGDVADAGTFETVAPARHVIHLAGRTFVPDSWKDPAGFQKTKVLGTTNALEYCRRHGAHMVFVSAYLYGVPDRLPIAEDCEPRPNNPYALSAHLAEQVCAFYADSLGLDVTVIRPFNIYGAGQREDFLVPRIVRQVVGGTRVAVRDLAPRRDYLHVDDLVDALIRTLDRPAGYRVYNIGSGESVSVGELIAAAQSAAGTSLPVESSGEIRPNEIDDVRADTAKARRELGWSPAIGLEQGLQRMVREERKLMSERHVPINKGNYSMDTPEREALFEAYRGEGWEEEYAAYRRAWSDLATSQAVSDYPLLVDLELASICNLRCPMCYTISDSFRQRVNAKVMDWEVYCRVIDEIGGKVPAIRLSLRGEATLHPKFVDCIRYAKDHGIGEVSTLTHGGRLTLPFFEQIVEAGIDWITVSADGVWDTYERVRKPLKFADLLDKLKDMKQYKDDHGLHRPVIKVQGIWPALKDDPQAYYDTFAPYVDMVAFNPLIDYLGKDEDIAYLDNFSCPQQYQRLVIGADGLVMKCSNDEENREVIGNIGQETVHQIWHGEKMQAVRELHKQAQGFMKSEVCRRCYLPRKTDDETTSVGGRTIIVRNYVNRSQLIGS
jgi:radical SAM protein with 4Fe4S-binding SPASM domain